MSRSTAHDDRNAAIREVFRKPLELASTAPTTGEMFQSEAQRLGCEHHVEDVPNSKGSRLHWMGDRSAEKVLLYFHGGGFCIPALSGHILFINHCQKFLQSKGENVAVALLEYSLTTASKYPVQILQGTESLRYILQKGYEPRNIVIGGDSAGANLTLAVLSVILHSFQGIQPLSLNGHLAGVLLISPWVGFSTQTRSWAENAERDVIPEECATVLTDAYTSLEERNNYSEPVQADVSWWSGIPAKAILNVYGDYEVLKDHIVELGEKIERAGNHVENVECPMQVHIDCILDEQSGLDAGLMSTKVWEWLSNTVI